MKKFTKKNAIIALMLVACLAVAGISAYFTDADSATNEFTIGNVSLDLQEPGWDALPDADNDNVPDAADDMVPGDSVTKDPKILNDGINDEYVFLTVAVPYANVVVAEDDGTKKAAADTELFTYTLNDGWVEIGTAEKDAANGVVIHTYAYAKDGAMTALAADAETTALFSSVKLVNLVEGEKDLAGNALNPSAQEIVINAYGIQADNINGGKTAPADVWQVVCNQREID